MFYRWTHLYCILKTKRTKSHTLVNTTIPRTIFAFHNYAPQTTPEKPHTIRGIRCFAQSARPSNIHRVFCSSSHFVAHSDIRNRPAICVFICAQRSARPPVRPSAPNKKAPTPPTPPPPPAQFPNRARGCGRETRSPATLAPFRILILNQSKPRAQAFFAHAITRHSQMGTHAFMRSGRACITIVRARAYSRLTCARVLPLRFLRSAHNHHHSLCVDDDAAAAVRRQRRRWVFPVRMAMAGLFRRPRWPKATTHPHYYFHANRANVPGDWVGSGTGPGVGRDDVRRDGLRFVFFRCRCCCDAFCIVYFHFEYLARARGAELAGGWAGWAAAIYSWAMNAHK